MTLDGSRRQYLPHAVLYKYLETVSISRQPAYRNSRHVETASMSRKILYQHSRHVKLMPGKHAFK